MNFRKWHQSLFASLLVICCFPTLAAAGGDSADSITKAIEDARIMAPGYKVSAAVNPGTPEVIISTYANSASKNVVTDCKIDAILIARKVIETAEKIVRVKVRFYQPNQASFQEVVVTKPDIAAFSTGSVKKDELLASLEVTQHDSGLQKSSDQNKPNNSPTAAANRFSTIGGVVPRNVLPTAVLKPTDKFSVFRDKGISFYYPKSWGAKEMNNQWGDFVELTNNRRSWSSIIFRLQDKDSTDQVADEDNKYYWSSHQRRILGQKTVLIGYRKNLQALVIYIKDNSNDDDTTRYEKHVYFGYKHRIYSMSVRFSKEDYAAVDADLNTILNTMIRE